MVQNLLCEAFRPERPEQQLLLACARVDLDENASDQIDRLLHGDLSWESLLRQAGDHRLTPLVYRHLRRQGRSSVPAEVLSQLQRRSAAIQALNMQHLAELVSLVAAFGQEQIPLMVLKGPVTAITVYGNLGLREFCDIDILVRRSDFHRAYDLLRERGYQSGTGVYRWMSRLPMAWRDWYLRAYSEGLLVRREPPATIDLHWALRTPGYSCVTAPDRLWEHARPVQLDSATTTTLCPEHELLFWCVHLAKHEWESLNLLVDIAELLRRTPQMDWHFVLSSPEIRGARRMVEVNLNLAAKLLGAPVPAGVLAELTHDSKADLLADRIIERWFPAGQGRPAALPWPWRTLFFRAMLSPGDRLRLLVYMWRNPLGYLARSASRILQSRRE